MRYALSIDNQWGEPMEWARDSFCISDDRERIDVGVVHRWLQKSYWAAGRSEEAIRRSVVGSLAFGLYEGERQIGFGRAVTDYATFAYIADIIIDDNYRGRGLGVWLAETIIHHPSLTELQLTLQTRDAHGLYERFGFKRSEMMKLNQRHPGEPEMSHE